MTEKPKNTRIEEAMSRARERAAAKNAPVWKPAEPGDSVAGRLLEIRAYTNKDGKEGRILLLGTEDGPVAVFESAEIARELRAISPVVGQELLILFGGVKALDGGKRMNLYTVEAI